MASGNQGLDQDGFQEGFQDDSVTIDFGFLARQTFDDIVLECEVLELFAEQSRHVLPTLPCLKARQQADAAHLLSGSARGIGAWRAAAAAAAYEAAAPTARATLYPELAAAFAATAAAIDARLASARR